MPKKPKQTEPVDKSLAKETPERAAGLLPPMDFAKANETAKAIEEVLRRSDTKHPEREAFLFDPDVMTAEMNTFLARYQNPVAPETPVDPELRKEIVLAYQFVGKAANDLATFRLEMRPEIRRLLDQAREALEPGFIDSLFAYCDELEAMVAALVRDIQKLSIEALMDPVTGRRQDHFLARLKEILKTMTDGKDRLSDKTLAGISPAYYEIDIGSSDAIREIYARVSGLLQTIGTPYAKTQKRKLRAALNRRGLKKEAATAVIEDVQKAHKEIIYSLLADSLESLSGFIIENMMTRDINEFLAQAAGQPDMDINTLKEKLLRFIHYALDRNRSAIGGQFSMDFEPIKIHGKQYAHSIDYRYHNQPLDTLKRLLAILYRTLKAMEIIQWIKGYLRASDI